MAQPSSAAYGPCPQCGCLVLRGRTDAGEELCVEPHTRTFVVVWHEPQGLPRLVPSMAYPVHVCASTYSPD